MRNSSLVEGFCAENVTGLKPVTEAVDVGDRGVGTGFGEQSPVPKPHPRDLGMVGERSPGNEGES